jgi:hypothetical protein
VPLCDFNEIELLIKKKRRLVQRNGSQVFIALDEEALVSDYLDSFDTYIHWNLSFIKAVQDWVLAS